MRSLLESKKRRLFPKDKKGVTGGLLTGIVSGIISLVLIIIISFVFTDTLDSSGLLTTSSASDNATDALIANYTNAVGEISSRVDTIIQIAVVVLILSVLLILWVVYKKMKMGGSGASEL